MVSRCADLAFSHGSLEHYTAPEIALQLFFERKQNVCNRCPLRIYIKEQSFIQECIE